MNAVVADKPIELAETLVLVPGKNLMTGSQELARQFGVLTSLEIDLLTVASATFAVDLATQRQEREHITRDFKLTIPVVNHAVFSQAADDLSYALYLLTRDNWDFEFTAKQGSAEVAVVWPRKQGKTLLFSGGLDSFAAAVDELTNGQQLCLASHYTANPVIQRSQKNLLDYLDEQFPNGSRSFRARLTGKNHASLPFPSDNERESTQRSRSLVFLTIGAIAARRTGFHEFLYIAENGQLAVHLPLTTARIGTFSTHTAHPDFVALAEQLMSRMLGFQFTISNPFLYRTKAECIELLATRHQSAINATVSCWKSSRQGIPHCGECVPCLIRRIAVEHHGILGASYSRDLLAEDIGSLSPEDDGKRNLQELIEFVLLWSGRYPDGRLEQEFPDLLSEHFDQKSIMDMYKRSAQEALRVFERYPGVKAIL